MATEKINEALYPKPGATYDQDQAFKCPDCNGPMVPTISGGRIFYETQYTCLDPACRSVSIMHDAYDNTKRLSTMVCVENWLASGPVYPAADPPDPAPDNRANQWKAVRRGKS